MDTSRLEAFSDGVIAILITIMVLELKIPLGADLEALRPLLPIFLTYILSFVFLGIYWNNHHHMLHVTEKINGKILWANLHLLFWLSLIPFVTGWMGENHFAPLPTAVYGVVLLMSAIAYTILQTAIVAQEGADSVLARAVGKDKKGKLSMVFYVVAIPLAFVHQWIADAIYILVALIWLIPDRRIESNFGFPVVAGETTEIDIIPKYGQTVVAEMRVVETKWEGETAYLASLRDITERKRAEAERAQLIREQAARAEAEKARKQIINILESITDGFIALDKEWRFTYANSEAEELFQRMREGLIGKNIWEEFPDLVGTSFAEQYQRAVAEQVSVEFEEFYAPLGIWLDIRAYPY